MGERVFHKHTTRIINRKEEKKTMLYEIHMIKNYPPTNLNRDDTGGPKTCLFGGIQRGRISSQCLKRSWRTSDRFSKFLDKPGIRTRGLPELVGKELSNYGLDQSVIEVLKKKITGIANKDGKENEEHITSQMIIYSPEDIIAISEKAAEFAKGKTAKEIEKVKVTELVEMLKDVKSRPITLDIALFGRMVTSDAFRNVEAAMQVAHAISTHAVSQESDYYTAVDDLIEQSDDNGAGMIGDIDYNSCCYYFYTAIDTDQLQMNLEPVPERKALIELVLPEMIEIMAFTNPSGKQNSFAGHSLPDLICIEVKADKVPVNYANAFVKPAKAGFQTELVEDSVLKLKNEIDLIDSSYGLEIKHRAWFCPRYQDVSRRMQK
jgi:CRISPR system Cascade subunit CasC